MAPPVKGLWAMRNTLVPDATNVWGTGINPVHMVYGEGPPIRVGGRPDSTSGIAPGVSGDQYAPVSSPAEGAAGYTEFPPADYGYMPEDLAGLDVFADPQIAVYGVPFIQDGWPSWTGGAQDGQSTPINRLRSDPRMIYPVGSAGIVANKVRGIRIGPRDEDSEVSNEIPVETVSEGWTNKTRGKLADSKPSDPSQYERQTSMQQRYAVRNNQQSVLRGTDEPRTEIQSRVAGQRVRNYSGQEPGSNRHYDMSPFQQDQINRPFRYRVAGTGYQEWLEANETYQIDPIRRTPPADPSLGVSETGPELDYGYTVEDNFYA
jgi:hypothetical protein